MTYIHKSLVQLYTYYAIVEGLLSPQINPIANDKAICILCDLLLPLTFNNEAYDKASTECGLLYSLKAVLPNSLAIFCKH